MRLYTILSAIPACLTLCSALTAQEDAAAMGPAKEQAKFHQLIGHWQGSGTVRGAAAEDAAPWTGTSVASSVLRGHFVREDTVIDLGAGAPAKIVFRTFYGYDKEAKKWMSHSVSNMGGAISTEVHWADGVMITGQAMQKMGKFVVERWSTNFAADKNSYTFNSYETHDNGKPFKHVTGKFTRVKAVEASATSGAHKGFSPTSEEMRYLAKWVGDYKMKGWMVMAPGVPKTNITASESIKSIFGGVAISFDLKGDPIPQFGSYEGWGAFLWNPELKCYQTLWVDNMGGATVANGYRIDGKFVIGSTLVANGQPSVRSAVFHSAEDGSLAGVREHATVGASDPFHAFQASYTKK